LTIATVVTGNCATYGVDGLLGDRSAGAKSTNTIIFWFYGDQFFVEQVKGV